MHARARILVAVALVAVFGSAGCGGKVSGDPAADSGSSDGSHSGSSSGSSGGGQVFGVCPSEAPTPGDACVTPNQGCIYLSNAGCAAFVCDGTSHWVSSSQGC